MEQQVVRMREGAISGIEEILDSESARRVFFVVDDTAFVASGAASALEVPFNKRDVTRFSGFDLNPKLDDVKRGIEMFRQSDPDVIIALGGGSAIDLAKLIGILARQDSSARKIIIGKAHITHFAVVYVDGEKYSLAHPYLMPAHVVIDPALTHSLPAGITAATGLDAFCQAIESIWAVGATEASICYAREAAQLALQHLSTAVQNPTAQAREGMCRAAHLSGKAINISKTTAPHALSYFLTTEYGLPHGFAVAVTLGSVLAYNAQVTASDCKDPRGPKDVLSRIAQIVEILGAADVADACDKIICLLHAVNCPLSLSEAGIADDDALQRMVSCVNPERLSNNPRKTTPAALHALLKNATLKPHCADG